MDATLGELMGGSISLSPDAQQITLKQLATHTAGFPSIPKPLGLKATELARGENLMDNLYSYLGPESIFNYLDTTEDKRDSGRFVYSNFGMGLLGHALEFVTKKSLATLVSEQILSPLDMRNTAISLTQEMRKHLAQGYAANGKPTPMWTFSALAGAGAFNSCAEDMMKFVRANIDESSILSQTLQKMHPPQCAGKTGIGWLQPMFLDRLFNNKAVVWHNGMVGGYASYISVDTKTKTGILIISSKAVDVTMPGIMLTRLARTQSWRPMGIIHSIAGSA